MIFDGWKQNFYFSAAGSSQYDKSSHDRSITLDYPSYRRAHTPIIQFWDLKRVMQMEQHYVFKHLQLTSLHTSIILMTSNNKIKKKNVFRKFYLIWKIIIFQGWNLLISKLAISQHKAKSFRAPIPSSFSQYNKDQNSTAKLMHQVHSIISPSNNA